ncbi:MAG TPA: hypothetical protein VHX37_13775 [Acidobacteriaceae bacterium]|jgi:hypothetical protein|nr:hypothetical protein [Acidobacteriaceae bacterium]
MQIQSVARAAVLVCFAGAFAFGASAQITVTSPTNGSNVSMPVWLRAHAASCAGSTNMTAFGYSINDSPLVTWGVTNYDIDTTDYRLSSQPSPGSQYTIRYKAWSDAGECPEVDVVVNVTGPATTTVSNINDQSNANGWNPEPCPSQNDTSGVAADSWFWQWDSGTAQCTNGNTTTYNAPSGSPSMDGGSRLFYTEWQSPSGSGNPGERYSNKYATGATSATHFVYDTYIYPTDPQNIQNLELDNNDVMDSSGDVMILGLQCAHGANSWQYTLNTGSLSQPQDSWVTPNPTVPCDPQTFAPNTWHHVQLAAHRDSSGNVYYDSITVDGKTTNVTWTGFDEFGIHWGPGDLILNYQVDGIYNGGQEATSTTYIDGMTMIYW